MPTPALSETVRVRNTGTEVFTGRYDGQVFPIHPGSEHFVPFVAACLWFGHPDAMDVDARNKYRTDEVERLRTKYGIYEATAMMNVPGIADTPGHPWANDTRDAFLVLTPDVEVYTLAGQKLIMVIDDPEGTTINPDTITQAERAQDQDLIANMKAQMAQMQTMLDKLMSGEVAMANAGPIGEDVDPNAPESNPEPQANISKVAASTATPGVKTTTGRTRVKPPVSTEVTEDTPERVKVSQ